MFSVRIRILLAWSCFIIHALAIGCMLLGLQNGLFLGDVQSRVRFIVENTALWQLGWALWACASLSLTLMMAAWADTLEYKGFGLIAVFLCFGGSLVDWVNDALLISVIPHLAQTAMFETFALELFNWWEYLYPVTAGGLAVGLYAISGLVLNILSLQNVKFPRWLAWFGLPIWLFSIAMSISGFTHYMPGMYAMSAATFFFLLPFSALLGYTWFTVDG